MTRDDVIELAHRICKTYLPTARDKCIFTEAEIMQFTEAVAAREHETLAKRCAEICSPDAGDYGNGYNRGVLDCEEAIAARSRESMQDKGGV